MGDKKVLIIEDDLGFFYILQKTLLKFGIKEVDSVTNGEEAERYIAGNSPYQLRSMPDLLFVDLKMAVLDGFELMAWLQSSPLYGKIPVVVLTGSTDPADEERSAALGAKSFFVKPVRQSELEGVVEKVLHKYFGENQSSPTLD
ncbi:MAG: response regulator [Verrucomicrobiota bacterium]